VSTFCIRSLAFSSAIAIACGADDRAPSDGGRSTDAGGDARVLDGGAGRDAAPSDAAIPTLRHFDTCSTDAECPDGDSCSAPLPDDPSTADPARPKQCRTPCTDAGECGELMRLTTERYCAPDGYCVGYCAPVSPFIAMCNEPYVCHRFVVGGRDGYCGEP
jgi:hypothetical protein